MPPALIEIRNATIYRGTTRVFDDLSLVIPQHQHVAVLGPNGSGKTTLLKTINRELYPVHRPDSRVRVLGRDRGDVWSLRKRIGLVSDDLQARYRPSCTATEVVVSGFLASIGVHGNLQQRIGKTELDSAARILAELGIASLADTPLARMSTGQKRRCLLGRALVHEPDNLILDEPTAGLDFAASFDYLDRIRRLARAGCSIVLVTHHLNDIPPEVERVILLDRGRVVADGDKAEVLDGALLSAVYGTPIRVTEVDGAYLAHPGEAAAKT